MALYKYFFTTEVGQEEQQQNYKKYRKQIAQWKT